MFRATLKSLAAHKVRLALTAIAIVLGVAFMAGTFVLTDTVKHSFDGLFQQTTVNKDIDAALAGNICRCGTYVRIRKAIHRAAELQRATSSGT